MQNPKNNRCWCSWRRGKLDYQQLFLCLSYSEAILLQSLHPMILKTRPLLLHSAERKREKIINLKETFLKILNQCLYIEKSYCFFSIYYLVLAVHKKHLIQQLERKFLKSVLILIAKLIYVTRVSHTVKPLFPATDLEQ